MISAVGDGAFVLDGSEGRLGSLDGDLMPFLTGSELWFAGSHDAADRVRVWYGADTGEVPVLRVEWLPGPFGVWLAGPFGFAAGAAVKASWLRDGEVLFDVQSQPLDQRALAPVFGPEWTSYAPL
jgi:hypothetical protein